MTEDAVPAGGGTIPVRVYQPAGAADGLGYVAGTVDRHIARLSPEGS